MKKCVEITENGVYHDDRLPIGVGGQSFCGKMVRVMYIMCIGETQLLEALYTAFPNKLIFERDFSRKLGLTLGYIGCKTTDQEGCSRGYTISPPWYVVLQYARAENMSTPQWLASRGFVWKERALPDEMGGQDLDAGYAAHDGLDDGDGAEGDINIQILPLEDGADDTVDDGETADEAEQKCEAEDDMEENPEAEAPEASCSAFDLSDFVFRKYPIAGAYRLTDQEDKKLYCEASKTLEKILRQEYISPQEEAVLVLETIHRLKGWTQEEDEEDEEGKEGKEGEEGEEGEEGPKRFWSYIYSQYGFQPERREDMRSAERRLYRHFQSAVKNTLTRYNRFFAPAGTKRYYTSLLLHALAPRESVESLYAILFDFYAKNLEFQYIPEDSSYAGFVKALSDRWNTNSAKTDEFQLRAEVISSGLQILFKKRPRYMAALCDSIVKKMDAIYRDENTDLIDPARNDWDAILVEWYKRKSSTERVRAPGEQRQRKTEDVATTADRIYAQYKLKCSSVDASVGVAIPKIRLSKVAQQRPVIKIYQSENCIYNAELSVTGDELCLTTRSRFIPFEEMSFEEMSYDFSNTPDIRVEIHYDGELLYNSAQKLHRQHILFDATGAERTARCGTIYLFASNLQKVTFPDDTDGIYRYPYPGQLYRINLDGVSSIAVDGHEIFVSPSTAAQFRHHTSIPKVTSAQVIHQGVSFDIFPATFQLFIVLPEGKKSRQYQCSIDGVRYSAEAFCEDGNGLKIPSENDGRCHCVRIIDHDNWVKYEFNYIVLAHFKVTLNAPIYYADGSQATADVSFAAKQFHYSRVLEDTSDSIIVSVSEMVWQLELHIPLARCTLKGHNAFKESNMIWHKDIPRGEFVQLTLPEGWDGQLMLGTRPIREVKSGCFELGNVLSSLTVPQEKCDLWLSLKSTMGEHSNRKITTIVCKPTFAAPPIEVEVVDNTLYWRPEGNYVGDIESTFQIEVQRPDGSIDTYTASTKKADLANTDSFDPGKYPYKIFLKKKSLFCAGENELIFQGTYCVGDPLKWLYDGKELVIGDAIYWDFEKKILKTLPMRDGCGILTDLDYQGESIASGETMSAPCYSATLSFIRSAGRRTPFNSKPSKDFELVNPVKVWIVNEHLLILRCTTEDGVYVDKDRATIVNRNPDKCMSRAEQKQRLKTPDYFKYSIREG